MPTWSEAWTRTLIVRRQIEGWLKEDSAPASTRTLRIWLEGANEVRRLLLATEQGWLNAIEAIGLDICTLPSDHPGRKPGAMEVPLFVQKFLDDLEGRINTARQRAAFRANI